MYVQMATQSLARLDGRCARAVVRHSATIVARIKRARYLTVHRDWCMRRWSGVCGQMLEVPSRTDSRLVRCGVRCLEAIAGDRVEAGVSRGPRERHDSDVVAFVACDSAKDGSTACRPECAPAIGQRDHLRRLM